MGGVEWGWVGGLHPEGGMWAAGDPKRVVFPGILFIYLSSCAASSLQLALVSPVSRGGGSSLVAVMGLLTAEPSLSAALRL